jgi:hypothetical protein
MLPFLHCGKRDLIPSKSLYTYVPSGTFWRTVVYVQIDMMWLGILGIHEMGDSGYFYGMVYFGASEGGCFARELVHSKP